MDCVEAYVGDEAHLKREALNVSFPIENGVVTDWYGKRSISIVDVRRIWHHAVSKELKVNLEKHPVLVTESPLNPKQNRETMTQIFFEDFDVPFFYVALQAVLSLIASGRITGTIVDSGYGVTHSVPIDEGYALRPCINRLDLAGRICSEWMAKLLEPVYRFSSSEFDLASDVKCKLCYVALDYEEELSLYSKSDAIHKSY